MGLNKNQEQFIERIYYEMYYSLSAYALSALNDRSLAEEAVQDTFRIACSKADCLISSPNPKGWLINTLKNVIRNTIRNRAQLNNLIVSFMTFDENTTGAITDYENVDVMYDNLTGNKDYNLLKKIVFEKCSMLEIANELGISVEACKKRVQRAKKKLRKPFLDKK